MPVHRPPPRRLRGVEAGDEGDLGRDREDDRVSYLARDEGGGEGEEDPGTGGVGERCELERQVKDRPLGEPADDDPRDGNEGDLARNPAGSRLIDRSGWARSTRRARPVPAMAQNPTLSGSSQSQRGCLLNDRSRDSRRGSSCASSPGERTRGAVMVWVSMGDAARRASLGRRGRS
jgi:hypothetical protein